MSPTGPFGGSASAEVLRDLRTHLAELERRGIGAINDWATAQRQCRWSRVQAGAHFEARA